MAIGLYLAIHYWDLIVVLKTSDPFKFRWWFQKDDIYLMNDLASGSWMSKIASVFHACGRRDVYIFSFVIFCFTGLPQAAVVWYFTIATAHAVLALVHVAAGGMTRRTGTESS